MMVETVPAALQFIKAGKLRALAVTTPQRISMLPDVPTGGRSRLPSDFDVASTFGVLAPAGTPAEHRRAAERGARQRSCRTRRRRSSSCKQGVYAASRPRRPSRPHA